MRQNLGTVIEADTVLKNELNLWWRYAKNDFPGEDNKLYVLARNNLLYLVNKFLLAHILKSYQSEASIVDSIESTVSLEDGLKIFEKLSEKIDFWNVFQTLSFENHITQQVWNDLIEFNLFLRTLKFDAINKELLHDLIGHTINKNKRKFAGQFTTSVPLANILVSLSLTDTAGHSYDPTCGSGTIARSIYNKKKSSIGVDKAIETTWASDKFSLPLQIATFNMIDPEAMGKTIQVFKEDATKINIGDKINLRDPFNGEVKEVLVPEYSLIASNLPFVQQEDIQELNPNIEDINAFIETTLGNPNAGLAGRTDLYGYLPFYFWKLLREGGTLAIIVSNSWLGTAWGKIFYETLKKFYKIKVVVTSGKGRWFENVKVITNLVILEKKSVSVVDNNKTKFIVTKKPIRDYSEEDVGEFVALTSLRDEAIEEDIIISSYEQSEINAVLDFGLSLNSHFANISWVSNFVDKVISASDLFEVARGERSGWDDMFYPGANSGIEPEYLKSVLKTPRSIRRLLTMPDAEAFCCDKTIDQLERLGHTGAIAWIRQFENLTNGNGDPLPTVLAKANTHWYTMKPDTMAEVVTNINFGDRLFFARFSEPTFVNQRLVRLSKKVNDTNVVLCQALLNSTFGLFMLEAMGIGRGEGALDLSKDKIEADLKMINPNQYTQTQIEEIIQKYTALEARDIGTVNEELESSDRDELDNAILEPLGLLGHLEDIKKSLSVLYKIRVTVTD